MAAATFAGLDLLATAVVILDDELVVRYANPAAENLLTAGARSRPPRTSSPRERAA
jgi:two-component system, NtrC family, nitrogen regulation sensor histidine kinase GlnL